MRQHVLLLSSILILSGFFFVSCNKDSETTYDAAADVFVKKILVDGVVKYAPMYYVYGSAAIGSATVTTPDGDKITLYQSESYSTIFLNSISTEDYSEEMPATGTYSFDVVFNSTTSYSTSDYFYDDELDIPAISECKWDDTDDVISVSWNAVDDVYAYNVNIYNASGNTIYSSAAYSSSITALTINSESSSWYSTPSAGDVLTVEVNAYSYESDASETYWSYNLQCISASRAKVTWESEL